MILPNWEFLMVGFLCVLQSGVTDWRVTDIYLVIYPTTVSIFENTFNTKLCKYYPCTV